MFLDWAPKKVYIPIIGPLSYVRRSLQELAVDFAMLPGCNQEKPRHGWVALPYFHHLP